jgi:hypothetical protein
MPLHGLRRNSQRLSDSRIGPLAGNQPQNFDLALRQGDRGGAAGARAFLPCRGQNRVHRLAVEKPGSFA